MFAPSTSMAHVELHGVHVTQGAESAASSGRPAQHSAPAYVTAASSAPEEVESIAMLSQMLQNEAQRHQRERAGYPAPGGGPSPAAAAAAAAAANAAAAASAGAAAKPPTTAADVMNDMLDGREQAQAQAAAAAQAAQSAAQAAYLEPVSSAAPAAAGVAGAPRISIDHLLGLPGFSAPIAPHFLAPRPAMFVPHPAHRGPPPPQAAAPPAAAGPLDASQPAAKDDPDKENGWQRLEIKREPSGPEEAARGLLALHKHHCHRLGTDGQPVTLDGDELRRKAHMARHRRTHTNERPHVCSVCFKGFIRREHLQRHMKIHAPPEERPYQERRKRGEGERPHVCNICFKAYLRREHLQRHMKIHEPPQDEPAPRHPCDLCGSTFLRREHMRRHRKTHTGKKEHVCYLCGKAFFRREHVRKHVMSHTKSGSATPGRGERAAPAAQLQPAAALVIEGTDLSVDSAGGSGGLEPQPGPSHHQQVPRAPQPRRHNADPDRPRNHVCGECGRRFARKEHLQRHEATHMGTRPFSCNQCDRTFNRKEHLKKHQQAPNCPGRPDAAAGAVGQVKRDPDAPGLAPPPPPQPTALLGFQPALGQHVQLLPQHMLGAVSTSHALDMSTQAQQPPPPPQPQQVAMSAAPCEQTRPLQLLLK